MGLRVLSRRGIGKPRRAAVIRSGGRYAAINPSAPLAGRLFVAARYIGRLSDLFIIRGAGRYRGEPTSNGVLRGVVRYTGNLTATPVQPLFGRVNGIVRYIGRLSQQSTIRGVTRYVGNIQGIAGTPYSFQRTLVAAGQADLSPGQLAHPIIRNVHLVGDWLKTRPIGRLGVGGHDLRFQIAGADADHEIEAYDAAAGTMLLNLRATSNYDAGTDLTLLALIGNTAITSATERPAAVWGGATAAWKFPGGGEPVASRTLTMGSVTTVALANGDPGGAFTAASFARRGSPTFLASLARFTLELRLKITSLAAQGMIFRLGSPSSSLAADNQITVQFFPSVVVGAATLTNTLRVNVQFSGVIHTVYYPDNSFGLAETILHIVCESGQTTKLYKDGARVTSTGTNAAATGTIAALSTDEISFGDPQGSTIPGLAMQLGRCVLYPRVMSQSEIAWSHRCIAEADTVVGISAEDVRNASNRGAVAVPIRQRVALNQTGPSVDLAARALEPESTAVTVTAVGAGLFGTVTRTGNSITYRRTAAGEDRDHVQPARQPDGQGQQQSLCMRGGAAGAGCSGPWGWSEVRV